MSMCVCVYMYLSDEWERIDKRAGLVRPSYVRDANDTPALNSGSAAQAEGLYNIYKVRGSPIGLVTLVPLLLLQEGQHQA